MTGQSTTESGVLGDTVSIIIPTYRRPDYLREAIQSAARQSSPPLEIVVVDDGGTLPAGYHPGEIPAHTELQIHQIPHAGQCGARRAGFDLSRGKFVLFLDDDDTLHPDAVATLRALHEREPGLVVAAGAAESVAADGTPRGRVNQPPREIRSVDLWGGNQIATAGCALIRRAAYQAVSGWDVAANNAADYMLWMKLARVGRIAGTEQVVLHYRSHLANETAKGNQFVELRAIRRTFRRVFPDLARSETEDSVIASLVTPYVHPAIRHWRDLVRRGEWVDALRRGVRILDGMAVASARPLSRRELSAALALWRPKWPRRLAKGA